MTSVGIRELRQRASELLRLVEAGETVEVTDRGRPVALITPVPALEGLNRLRADGDVADAKDTIETLPPPLKLNPTQQAKRPSQVLAQLRDNER